MVIPAKLVIAVDPTHVARITKGWLSCQTLTLRWPFCTVILSPLSFKPFFAGALSATGKTFLLVLRVAQLYSLAL